jgi:hypothetical protein
MYLFADLRKFSGRKSCRENWVCKSQIRKVSHLRKVRKPNKLFKSANLRNCDLQGLISVICDRTPVLFVESLGPFLNKQSYFGSDFNIFFGPF